MIPSVRVVTSLMLVVVLGACAASRQFQTLGSNAFHEMTIEVSPDLQKIATLENLGIERKKAAGSSFVVSGDIQYGRSCQILSLNVSFINTEGVALRNTQAPIMNYAAKTKARFQASAYINAMVGETKDIIDKVVISDLKCM